jgi:uncharacterized protein YicC (UPF0701 family)
MDPGQIAVFIPIVALSIPIVAIWTKHLQKMEEIRSQKTQGLNSDVQAKLDALQRQIIDIKDQSSRFDLALDASQDRLEERIAFLEEKNTVVNTSSYYPTAPQSAENAEQRITIGNR